MDEESESTEPSGKIDWQSLARSLGTIREDGESGGTHLAKQALEILIGDDEWRDAVDHYVFSGRPTGSELVRSVMWLIHPWAAMQRCDEIYRTSDDADDRCSAIELLRVVADRRVLPWIPGYLADPDDGVLTWAAGIVDQLIWSELVEVEECSELLAAMEHHSHPNVRETFAWIQSFLDRRKRCEEPGEEAEAEYF